MGQQQKSIQLGRSLKSTSRWIGWAVVLGGSIVLMGWVFRIELLKRVLPNLVAMNPITALGFVIAGLSLAFYWQSDGSRPMSSKCGRLLATVLIVIGGLKLYQYFLGVPMAFDQLLFKKQLQSDETGFANQIAPNTAFNFLLSGLVLWLLNAPHRRFSRWAQNLSLVLAFVSLVSVVGYLYRASYLYGIGSYIPMALHTAILFYLLAHGLLLAQTDFGAVSLFTSETPGGVSARRLLPIAFGLPILLGALRIWGERMGLYPTELGVTVMIVSSVAILTLLIWWNAILLNWADLRRREAEESLQRAHSQLESRVEERTAELKEVNQALRLEIVQHQKAEEKIREQAELLDKAQDAIVVLDMQGRINFWNKGAERLYGWDRQDAVARRADEILFKSASRSTPSYETTLRAGTWTGELEQVAKSGQVLVVESSWTLVKDDSDRPKCILIINTNITEKKNYELQLLRSQRMESIGTLAGGIAHDLNNALTPVIMGAQLLRENQDEDDRLKMLDTIYTSAKRGTEMVKQILSFARGTKERTGSVELPFLIKEMAKIVHDTFPKSISVQAKWDTHLKKIAGDATELHQVLLNLCVNARDAMPHGGTLSLRATAATLNDQSVLSGVSIPAGSYVVLSVSDTGSGIPADVLPRIFEPFFSTKAPDRGTGLGLSTVATIVKHHKGFLQVSTKSGEGTEFKIHFPATESGAEDQTTMQEAVLPVGSGELILIMDDEEAVRELAKTTLENYGYNVLTAQNGLEGIARFQERRDEIKVMVSDTDMPFLNGLDAIRTIQGWRPDIRIIIASGAKRDSEHFRRIDTTHVTALGKPYTIEQLLNAVAKAISTAKEQSMAPPIWPNITQPAPNTDLDSIGISPR